MSTLVRQAHGPRMLEAGDGPPVLLLHSISGSASGWRHWMRILADAGFRAVAPDLPGFGAPPVEPTFRYAPYLDLIAQVVSEVDGSREWAVVGDSLGGLLALQFCERGPIDRCVLLETPAVFPYPWLGPVTRAAVVVAQRPRMSALAHRLIASRIGRRILGALELLYTADPIAALDEARNVAIPPLLFLVSVMHTIVTTDLAACAARVRQPVLMVAGSRDRWAPVGVARRVVALLRDGRLHVVEGFRHGDAFHRPEPIAQIVVDHLRGGTHPLPVLVPAS